MGGRGTVLIVDDDEGIRGLTEMLLRREGYTTVVAADGKEALALYEKGKFTAILSDYQMPIMNGYELCQRVKTLDETMPFVMMTGSSNLPNFEVAPDDVIAKPFDINDFYKRFEAAIDKYKAA